MISSQGWHQGAAAVCGGEGDVGALGLCVRDVQSQTIRRPRGPDTKDCYRRSVVIVSVCSYEVHSRGL